MPGASRPPSSCRSPRTLLVLVSGLLAAACGSIRVESETLPFHVAIVPFLVHETERSLALDESRGERLLAFDGDALAGQYAGALDGLSFTQVSCLAAPSDVDAAEFAAWPAERRARHWVEAARAARADLLFIGDLVIDPYVQTTVVKSSLWWAFWEGLWKLGTYLAYSPQAALVNGAITVSGWDGDERAHRLHVRLDGVLLDPGQLEQVSPAELENGRALVRSFRYETDARSSFHRRQDWFSHFLSFLVPGAILPSDRAVLTRSLRERTGTRLLRQLVQDIEVRKSELLAGAQLFPFRVESLVLVPEAAQARLRCALTLDTRVLDRMDGYRVWVDGVLAEEGGFAESTERGEGRARYELELALAGVTASSLVRLELRDDAPRQHARTFTLRAGRTGRRNEGELRLELPGPR